MAVGVLFISISNSVYANYAEVSIAKKQLVIYGESGQLIKAYNVRTGLNPGCKTTDGDKKTPCGEYKIVEKRNSKYVKFLALNYPNAQDRKKGYTGDSIGIHYYNRDVALDESTLKGSLGCLTVFSKQEILQINQLLKVGDRVIITLE